MSGGKSDISKRSLSSETSALLVLGTEFHVLGAAICRRQAAEIFDAQKDAAQATEEGDEEVDPLGLSQQRVVHELEAAVHCAALTSIACTLATLEAQGFEVRGLCAARWEAEEREKKKDESPS